MSPTPASSRDSHNLTHQTKSIQADKKQPEKCSGWYTGLHKHSRLHWRCEQALRQRAVCLGMSL